MTIDIDQIIVVNGSSTADRAGPIYLFKNLGDAESYLEPIDVLNEEYFGYSLDGRKLKLSVIDNKVRIDMATDGMPDPRRIRSLLEASGAAVLAARQRRRLAESDLQLSALSISDLVKLIGFSA